MRSSTVGVVCALAEVAEKAAMTMAVAAGKMRHDVWRILWLEGWADFGFFSLADNGFDSGDDQACCCAEPANQNRRHTIDKEGGDWESGITVRAGFRLTLSVRDRRDRRSAQGLQTVRSFLRGRTAGR